MSFKAAIQQKYSSLCPPALFQHIVSIFKQSDKIKEILINSDNDTIAKDATGHFSQIGLNQNIGHNVCWVERSEAQQLIGDSRGRDALEPMPVQRSQNLRTQIN
ncbi:hypothetical protein DespoDRAFT_03066 [Desulfobacter postgatei 2ac9]|uniref:Uncharacterized protein n=1 Tax=Desulfobacter postgatei 2ac9 TaxID=879212 RepID=I5B5W1_9BACT|nr:hypothetical protein DespoDRAFT_03066 [Desulfobacter postgatei 2ac9]